MYLGIRFRAIESRQEASAVVPRRAAPRRSIEYSRGETAGIEDDSPVRTFHGENDRPGERFSLIGCDRSRRVSPLLSSQLLYLLHSALFSSFSSFCLSSPSPLLFTLLSRFLLYSLPLALSSRVNAITATESRVPLTSLPHAC